MTLGGAGSTGTFIYTGASDDSLGRTITLNGNGGEVTVSNAAANLTIAGQISGTGGLRITGLGIVVLASSTTYTGATIIGQGTLRQSSGDRFSERSAFILSNAPGSVLDLNNFDASLGSLAGGGPLGGTVVLGNPSLGAGADNTSTTFSGTITGLGGFVKTGAGTMKLNGTNTYTGVTNVSAGKLQFSGGNAIADTSPLLISANATAELLDSTETVASILGAGTIALSGGNINIGADNSGTLYEGVITGTGNFTKTGTGTLRLSKSPTYTGTTTLNTGGVALDAGFETAGALITIAAGATLQARGVVNRSVTGSGTIMATGTLLIGDGNSTSGFNLGGALAVGTRQVTLSDANMADLGNLTTLDSGAQLGSINGIRVAAGRSVLTTASASATIAGPLLNNGSITGPTQSGQALHLAGDVTGTGSYNGLVSFTKSFSPGMSAAAISLENFTLASTNALTLEIGGLAAGTQYDRLNFSGSGILGGILAVTFINGFTPAEGNSFALITGGTLSGAFDSFSLPNLNPTLAWRYSQTPNSANLVVVPEPSSTLLMSLTVALFLGLRRRFLAKPAVPGSQ
jgi:autotransporter-associated beta strand protein